MKQVIQKYGKNLSVIVDNKMIAHIPDVELKNKKSFLVNPTNPFIILEKLGRATFRSISVINRSCTICKPTQDVEIHHVREIKKSSQYTQKDYLTKMISRINRKQIPICRTCHIERHRQVNVNKRQKVKLYNLNKSIWIWCEPYEVKASRTVLREVLSPKGWIYLTYGNIFYSTFYSAAIYNLYLFHLYPTSTCTTSNSSSVYYKDVRLTSPFI